MTRYQIVLKGGVWDFQTGKPVEYEASSATWHEYEAWLTAGNTPLPPSTVGQDDLPTSKAKRKSEIDAYAAGLRNAVVRGRSAGEMASWSLKLQEARAYNAATLGTSAPLLVALAPTLAAIAQIRGVTLKAMVDKVTANSAPFLQAEAAIDGMRGKHGDAIDAMPTVAAIITYDWLTGWPVIP